MLNALVLATLAITGAQAAFGRHSAGEAAYPQTFSDEFNPLKYVGNVGPYSQRIGNGISLDVPEGCTVDQAVFFSRHGERFPTPPEVTILEGLLKATKAKKLLGQFTGSLSFLNDYDFFLDNAGLANLEVPTGPYSGLTGSRRYGSEAAARYGHLWDQQSVIPIFTDNYERDLETARNFGQGFFGFNYTNSAAINLYPSFDAGCLLGTFTTCPIKIDFLHLNNPLRYQPLDDAATRLAKENLIPMTADDVFGLMTIAAYELSAKGDSPWVQVFKPDEWIAFQYAWDAFFDCAFGHQSPRSKALGTLYINATQKLLNDGPQKSLPLGITFAHDVDLLAVIAALGLVKPHTPIDPYHITFNTGFRLTDIVPMGSRLIAERINCGGAAKSSFSAALNTTSDDGSSGTWTNGTNTNSTSNLAERGNDNIYVRYILNDAVVPWANCTDGPGFSCPLGKYNKLINKVLEENDYETVCHSQPPSMDFFWNYNTSNALNYNMNDIPYQAGSY